MESAKLIAGLLRIVRDIAFAEELAQDALVAALEKWPVEGIPRNPAAWLMAAGKFRAIDLHRRRNRVRGKHAEIAAGLEQLQAQSTPAWEDALDDSVGDDMLRLMFTACHPALPPEARVALTLRLLAGLTTDEIARAFLAAEATIQQRIVRAKRTLAKDGVPYEVPRGAELAGRIGAVLEVIYAVFNEGHTATAGEDLMRPALCEEGLRLGRILAELAPAVAEVHGLVALMEIQASRSRARVNDEGEPVVLFAQNRALWDGLLIERGLSAIARAEATGAPRGPYLIQASIAACHARARTPEETDWSRIVELYAELGALTPSPVIELNRAVAVSMAEGPAAGLAIADRLLGDPALYNYHLLPTVRADLLAKLGRTEEAGSEWERAAALTRNARERALLLRRAAACRED